MAGVLKVSEKYVIKLRAFNIQVETLPQSILLLILPFQPIWMVFLTQKYEEECLNGKKSVISFFLRISCLLGFMSNRHDCNRMEQNIKKNLNTITK